MAIAEASATNLWRVLAGRGPDGPIPADVDLWQRVRDRLNPAKARPHLRDGVEFVDLESFRVGPYVMVRSPGPAASSQRGEHAEPAYVRLAPEEAALAKSMDGTKTVAQLVGEFAKATGRLAPDQVQRVIADLAGGRMLEELPLDAFARVRALRRGPWPVRVGKAMVRSMAGKRMVVARPDRVVGWAYRFGGRLLFTRVGAALMVATAVAGFGVFLRTFTSGTQSAFLAGDSFLTGAVLLLGLNVLGLLFHEAGHALGTKHADRHVGAVGFLLFFGIPSAFVDTTDMWMASRKHRLIASGAGPGFALAFAGAAQVAGLLYPPFAFIAFKLAFAWYLNTLFNLNPLMTLDGYYMFMDWLEVPGLRAKGMAFTVAAVRRPAIIFRKRRGEARLIARYAAASALWTIVMLAMLYGMFRQRYLAMGLVLWRTGWPARLFMVGFGALLVSPLAFAVGRWALRTPGRLRRRLASRDRAADLPRRLDALRGTRLGSLAPAALDELAREATWTRPRRGSTVVPAGASPPGVIAVVDGALEGRRPGDPGGHVRARAGEGELVGVAQVLGGGASSLEWSAVGTRLLTIPAAVFARVVGPLVPKPPPAEQAEIENLLDQSPAFAGVEGDARLALVARAKAVDIEPGQRFRVKEGYGVLVGSGVIATTTPGSVGTTEARAGHLVGPPSGEPIEAQARSRSRIWSIAAVGGLAPFLGAAADRQTQLIAHRSPITTVHGEGTPAPLVIPWGAPPPDPERAQQIEEAEDRLAESMRKLLVLLVALALLAIWFASWPGDAWAEIPSDTAVLEVTRGKADVVIEGERRVMTAGDRAVISHGDAVSVRRRSSAEVTFRGDGDALLCPRTKVTIGHLESHGVDPVAPSGDLTVLAGKVVVDTTPKSGDFAALEVAITLVIDPGDATVIPPRPPETAFVENEGLAAFAPSLHQVEVAHGDVRLDGTPVAPSGGPLDCGEGTGGIPVLSTADTTTTLAPTTTVTTAVGETTTTEAATVTTRRRPRSTTTVGAPTEDTAPPGTAPPETAPPATDPPTSAPPTTASPTTAPGPTTTLPRCRPPGAGPPPTGCIP